MKIELGSYVKDSITGFEGTAISRTEFLYGCARISIQPKVDKDGKVPSEKWFDELQLQGMKPDKNKGGPQNDCPPLEMLK